MTSVAFDGRDREPGKTRALRQNGWILLILLATAALRLVGLAGAPPGMDIPEGMAIPPGMTHDEADHGLTAWEIVNGARDIYFTVGYGREPLYDYATALVMAGTGPTIFAARLTSVYFSLLMIAAVYAWSHRAFGRPVALLTAAGLAIGFWPVMAGRQALRSIALPAVFALAVLFFWQGSRGARAISPSPHLLRSFAPLRQFTIPFVVAGLLLGLTFYTYIPARVMWLAFPALAVYLLLAAPPAKRRAGRLLAGLGLTLGIAALVATPLFLHLANNPGLEVRINELSAPLQIAADGDISPLWFNARRALRLFTIEGDHTWRYNIPGKPFLGTVMGVLFYVGLGVAVWSAVRGLWRKGERGKGGKGAGEQRSAPSPFLPFSPSSSFLALVWLALGFAPVLVTGPGLSMTQAVGAMPVLYVFPALALVAVYGAIREWVRTTRTTFVAGLVALILFTTVGIFTVRDYFGRWANESEVRVQYETTMVTALRYLDEHGRSPATISTITPGRYHTPAVAQLTLHNSAVTPRYFDGRYSLLLPGEASGLLVVPGFTPIPAELQRYLGEATLIDELPMRPDDLDRPVRIYELSGPGLDVARLVPGGNSATVDFHNAALLGYDLSAAEVHPGDVLALVTAWRLEQPLPNASLFAHLAGPVGPLAVADGLGAPGEAWIAGDILLQLHTIAIPGGTPAGTYPLVVGVYTQDDGQRLTAANGDSVAILTTVAVIDD